MRCAKRILVSADGTFASWHAAEIASLLSWRLAGGCRVAHLLSGCILTCYFLYGAGLSCGFFCLPRFVCLPGAAAAAACI